MNVNNFAQNHKVNAKKFALLFILLIAAAFVFITVFSTNSFVHSLNSDKDAYFNNKQLRVTGTIMNYEKASGPIQLIKILPTSFYNQSEPTNLLSGFYAADTSSVAVLCRCKNMMQGDSIAINNTDITIFKESDTLRFKIDLLRKPAMLAFIEDAEQKASMNMVEFDQ